MSDLRFSDLGCQSSGLTGRGRIDLSGLRPYGQSYLVLRLKAARAPVGALRLDYETWRRDGSGDPSRYTHPSTTPGTPVTSAPHCYTGCSADAGEKGAMGSKRTLRNSQKAPQVNLRRTIWLLALFLAPCCKNQLVSKAPTYLRLSIPCEILSRPGTLP